MALYVVNILRKTRWESITEHKICVLSQQLLKSDEWQDFLSNHNNKFQRTNLISDYILEKVLFSNDIYVTTGQFCYSKKVHAIITSVKALFLNDREADQNIPNHVLFANSLGSSVCVVQMIPIFIS